MSLLSGKVVLITGGARGMGAAEARLFVEEGARVVIGDILTEPGEQLAAELGDSALFVHHDVASPSSWKQYLETALGRFERTDVLVNNAGIILFKDLLSTTVEEYNRVIAVNQLGTFMGMQTVAPVMIDNGGGSIINISSISGLEAGPNTIAYTSSKFAIRGMTKSAAVELGRYGIRVNSIHPGGVDTAMGWGDSEDESSRYEGVDLDRMYASLPLGRIGKPIEVARMALFLASDQLSYCTGAEFVVDGGLTCGRAPPATDVDS